MEASNDHVRIRPAVLGGYWLVRPAGGRADREASCLAGKGVTTASMTSPGELETVLLQALTAFPRPERQKASVTEERRVWTIAGRVRGITGRAEPGT